MQGSFTIDLDAPVNSYGEMLTELTLKAPLGRDILECGYPFSTERNPRTGGQAELINVPAVRMLIARCCGVPDGTVDQLTAVDFLRLVERLKLFFYHRSPKTSSPATSQLDAGQGTNLSSSG